VLDFSTDAFKGIEPQSKDLLLLRDSNCFSDSTQRDLSIQWLVGGLARWDARHFLHVAEFGYTWESTLAFFPLYPALLHVFGSFVQWFFSEVSLFNAMIASGVVVNNVSLIYILSNLPLFRFYSS
jgi:hypothetical protein